MFGFRRHKFTNKCKSDIKMLKVRLEVIMKKRNAVLKHLKNDVADLLKNGFDMIAYGRVEGVQAEQNMTTCYQLMESFINCISSNLKQMQKQKNDECPEECKEAVSSLIYAAARFSDLPELRDLRNIFTGKYGDSVKAFVNKAFMDKFKSKPATKETKVELMHQIANEHSIEWDSKSLEQQLFNPPPTNQAQPPLESQSFSDDGMHVSEEKDTAFLKRKDTGDEEIPIYITDNTASVKSSATKDATYDKYKLHSSSDGDSTDFSHDDQTTASSSVGSRSEEEAENKLPLAYKFRPPPYYKPKSQNSSGFEELWKVNHHAKDNEKPMSVRRRSKPPAGSSNNHGSDPKDKEEKAMDGLLKHFSQKQSPYDLSSMKGSLKPRNYQSEEDANESTRRKVPVGRAVSLPSPEPSVSAEPTKQTPRANSFQPDAHVHPRLPDYEDLAARIAALRGI